MRASITELRSDSGHRKAIVNMDRKEVFSIDFYEHSKYICSIEYVNKSLSYIEDIAEDWILDKFDTPKYHA